MTPQRNRHRSGEHHERGEGGREFGRDGVSGLVSSDRALRAREVSRPREDDLVAAERVVDALVARASGRRR